MGSGAITLAGLGRFVVPVMWRCRFKPGDHKPSLQDSGNCARLAVPGLKSGALTDRRSATEEMLIDAKFAVLKKQSVWCFYGGKGD
jgi:hypothetical protein